MAGQAWYESAPLVSDGQQAPQQRGGVFIPDQGAIDDARRADASLGYQGEGNARDAERLENDVGKVRRQGMADLRKEFVALPSVQAFNQAVTALDTGLRTTPDGSGDGTLLYQYSKLMDPMGSVREGDVQLAQSGAGYFSAKAAQLQKDFGIGSGGTLPANIREGLRREMISRATSLRDAYNQDRSRFISIAKDSGYDPDLTIGKHAGAAFRENFRKYDELHGNALPEAPGQGEGQPSSGNPFQGVDPKDITFDIDTGTGAFGSDIEGKRLSPEDQAEYRSFLQTNAKHLTPDLLNAWWKAKGFGGIANADEVIKAAREGNLDLGVDYRDVDAEKKRLAMEASYKEVPEGGDVSSYGLEKGLLLNMTDELRGGIGGVRSFLSGDGFSSGYEQERNIERSLQERSRNEAGLLPELVGGLMTPAGLISKASMARDAAAMGAIAGYGEGEGAADSLSKAATGGALGYGGGKLVDKYAPAIGQSAIAQRLLNNTRSPGANDFAQAADRQGLDYLAADVPGATKIKFATSVAKSTLGGIPLSEAAGNIASKAKIARDRIAGNVGEVAADTTGAGQTVKRGMETWERKTAGRGGELYDAIPIKPDMPVDLSTTRQTLSDLNGSITSNDDLAALVRDPRMVAYQKALESGDLSWKDVKSFRSFIGEKAGRPTLQQDTSKDSLDALYGALSTDIERAAAAHSPEAAKASARANNYWRGRQSRLNDVMTKLVGKDGKMAPEATFAQIERWAGAKGGDYTSLARAIRSLPDDEANTVRATIIDRLGDSNPGAQNAANDSFSPDVFLTQWAKLSDRAKGVLFQGEHRKALDDLATVFEGTKFSRGFDNNSKTSIGVNATALGLTSAVSVPTAAALSALQFGGGKLLASPRFARWIVALGKKPNPSAQLAHINQLTAIARAEPVIANDIFSLQQRLADQFQKSPGALAAQDSGDGRGEPPTQGERNDTQ